MSTARLNVAPMDLRSAAAIPDGPQWLYEPKWENAGISRIPLKTIYGA